MDKLIENISLGRLFPERPTIHFKPEIANFSSIPMQVQKTRRKTIATLEIGEFIAKETIFVSPETQKKYICDELQQLVPTLCKFGYDILVYIGKAIFLDYWTAQEIVQELKKKNITISKSEIAYLAKRFIVYLAIIHQQSARKLKKSMEMRGGYILHLDGTCEGGSPHLMSGLDEISTFVLHNVKMLSEGSKDIIPFLEKIKNDYGTPLAVVNDMGKAIVNSVEEVFPGTPDFICHFHFLRDIGKDLFQAEYDTIRKLLKKYSVTSSLEKLATKLKKIIQEHPGLINKFETEIDNKQFSDCSLKLAPVVSAYALILWALDGKNQSKGYGFPFDCPYVVYAQRIRSIYLQMEELLKIPFSRDWRDNLPFGKVCGCLRKICSSTTLKRTLTAIELKIEAFDKLRKAMRITVSEQSQGLNDDGNDVPIKTIESGVIDFRAWLLSDERISKSSDYKKMIDQLDKYWEKLFAAPIAAQTPQGEVMIQPQRTNNILERFFRDLKRGCRCKTKTNSMSKTLKTMLAQTPLVKNLKNQEYLNIILNGKTTLEKRFSEIDASFVRKELKKSQEDLEKIPPKIRRIIKDSALPKHILEMFIAKSN